MNQKQAMPKDLQEEFQNAHLTKAKDEIGQILDKHQLNLIAELRYTDMGIFPLVKLVERKSMSGENQPVEAPVEQPIAEEVTPEAVAE